MECLLHVLPLISLHFPGISINFPRFPSALVFAVLRIMWPVALLASISQSISRPQPKNVSIMLSPATTTSSRIESIEPEQNQRLFRGGGASVSAGIRGIPRIRRPKSQSKHQSQGNREQFSIATAQELATEKESELVRACPGSEAGLRHGLLAKHTARPECRGRSPRWPAAGRHWEGRQPAVLHQAEAQPPAPLQLRRSDPAGAQRWQREHCGQRHRRQPVRPGAPQSAADQERGRLREGNRRRGGVLKPAFIPPSLPQLSTGKKDSIVTVAALGNFTHSVVRRATGSKYFLQTSQPLRLPFLPIRSMYHIYWAARKDKLVGKRIGFLWMHWELLITKAYSCRKTAETPLIRALLGKLIRQTEICSDFVCYFQQPNNGSSIIAKLQLIS